MLGNQGGEMCRRFRFCKQCRSESRQKAQLSTAIKHKVKKGGSRPRKIDDDCLQELRLMDDRRDLSAWLAKWSGESPKLSAWVEETIEETLSN
jgi:transposase-like protein